MTKTYYCKNGSPMIPRGSKAERLWKEDDVRPMEYFTDTSYRITLPNDKCIALLAAGQMEDNPDEWVTEEVWEKMQKAHCVIEEGTEITSSVTISGSSTSLDYEKIEKPVLGVCKKCGQEVRFLGEACDYEIKKMLQNYAGITYTSEDKDYPAWVCNDCGTKASKGRLPDEGCTWHEDICGICGEKKIVTEPRDFGYPRFDPITPTE